MKRSIANPALWAILGIPIAAVLASLWTLFLSIEGADAPLPAEYATEGKRLEEQLALREAARRTGLRVRLDISSRGEILAQVQAAAGTPQPRTLHLQLTHATFADRDCVVELQAAPTPGLYEARLDRDLQGSWLLLLGDPRRWQMTARLEIPAAGVTLGD